MDWALIANIATVITSISLVAAIIQLISETKAQNLQSFFYLHKYLSQDSLGFARKVVRTKLCNSPYEQWGEEEKEFANRVCASYDQTGILISIGILSKKTKVGFLLSSWGRSIVDQYESLKPFLDDKQTPNQTGREFFWHFAWLYKEAKKYHN